MAGRRKQSQLLHVAKAEADRWAGELPRESLDPIEQLQFILGRRVKMFRYVAKKVDELSEDKIWVTTAFGPLENEWLRLEKDLAQEISTMLFNMERIGIAERAVAVQEAKAALLVQAITAAAREAGIPREQVKKLGPALRTQLVLLQGGGEGGAPGSPAEAA